MSEDLSFELAKKLGEYVKTWVCNSERQQFPKHILQGPGPSPPESWVFWLQGPCFRTCKGGSRLDPQSTARADDKNPPTPG